MIASLLRLIGLSALCLCSFGADLVLSGGMEALTQEALTVRLDDGRRIFLRLPKKGDLAAPGLAARFHLADRVQLTCKRIDGVWVKNGDYLAWDLKQLQFLRTATPEELSDATAPRPWRDADNLLKGAAVAAPWPPPVHSDSTTGLERARQVNLEYVAKLPNFVADEIAKRSRLPGGSANWQAVDTVESEISFQGNDTARQHVRVNGKAWKAPSLPLFNWTIGFGQLKPLFDPECPTTIESAGSEEVGGKQLAAYRFQSPVDGCFTFLTDGLYSYNPVRTGRFLVDETSGRVVRFEVESVGLPAEFRVLEEKEVTTWGSVQIGDQSHWLPVAFDITYRNFTRTVWRAAVEYRNQRHFEAATTVTFR